MLRPRIRIPLWAAAALPVAAYVFRSVFLRGGDFRPDLPVDAIIAVLLVLGIAITAWYRARTPHAPDGKVASEQDDEGQSPDEQR